MGFKKDEVYVWNNTCLTKVTGESSSMYVTCRDITGDCEGHVYLYPHADLVFYCQNVYELTEFERIMYEI